MSASTSNTIFAGKIAAEAIPSGSLVRINASGRVALPSASQRPIGSIEHNVSAADVTAGRACTVRLFAPTRVLKVSAGAPLTAGDLTYLASGGTISNTGTILAGVLLENAPANNDFAEIATVI